MVAVEFARLIDPYRVYWLEEPVSSRDLASLAEVRGAVSIPIVTGEELYGLGEFRDVFAHRAADILNPDVCATGGILELTRIGAVAATHHVAMAPHQYNSLTCGLAATLHAAAGMSNLLVVEYFVNHEQPSAAIAVGGVLPWKLVDGALELPPGPGLGIELDPQALVGPPDQVQSDGIRSGSEPGDEPAPIY